MKKKKGTTRKKKPRWDLSIHVCGYNDADRLQFEGGIWQGGGVVDGVCFSHIGNDGRSDGAWLMRYRDLMRMAEAATAARKRIAK